MTSPNHIVGGIAITGISLSFWDINIFSNVSYLGLCIFSSLLPDIDHTKSLLGKMFYPIAKYLDKKFGHRTITHSITVWLPLFIFFCFFELNVLNVWLDKSDINYSLIFQFSYLSHLILDMLTVSGIPLFYPFMKNPCVIPANPNLRFRSGDLKSESIALLIFGFVIFSSFDLFKNGFWTSYNRSFGTIKHAYREFRDSQYLVITDYNYLFNGTQYIGKGYIIEASENNLVLYSITDKKIINIDNNDVRFNEIELLPSKTNTVYKANDFKLYNVEIENLNDTLSNKIVSGNVISTSNFKVNGIRTNNGQFELNRLISPYFEFINDTINIDLVNDLKIKKAKLKEIENDNNEEYLKLEKLKLTLRNYENNLKNSQSIYDKNKFESLIIAQKKKINSFNLKIKNTDAIREEIRIIEDKLNEKVIHKFTASLKVYDLPKKTTDKSIASE